MNLQNYVHKYGTAKLYMLAELVGKKPSYFSNLLYAVNNNPIKPRRPSIALAQKMVEASGNQLTLTGLANPVAMTSSDRRPRMKKGFRNQIPAMLESARQRIDKRRCRSPEKAA